MFNGLTNYRIWGLALCYAYRWGAMQVLQSLCRCCNTLACLLEHKAW